MTRPVQKQQAPGLALLCWLRWAAVFMQAAIMVGLSMVPGSAVPLAAMLAVLTLIAGSNLWLARQTQVDRSSNLLGAVLLADVLGLTFLLWGSGGPANPFSVFYLIQITLAAVLGTGRWLWLVLLSSCLGFAALFLWHVPLPAELGGHGHGHHGGTGSYSVHLQLMWIAFALVGTTIAISVSRLSKALSWEQERREKSARLLGMAALAAGAAHEIGNPLGTIRMAASELERSMRKGKAPAGDLQDIQLIEQEVVRATSVLKRMASAAGELQGEGMAPAKLADFFRGVAKAEGGELESIELVMPEDAGIVRWPLGAVGQAISQLLRNAVQVSDGRPVRCQVESHAERVEIYISDQGPGMDPELVARVGEPFLSGDASRGMGLGLFIAKSLIEQLQGQLELRRVKPRGTLAWVELPRRVGERGQDA